ncbi:winged helix-turn-helix domain-containing protein [Streptomyces sp. P9-A2]|uniref:winged helix-turn-helix domain-containing protein n=1 Tax=Streptomyces sp. P9-A2 TaxID=3072284 RepID=UPI002FC5CD2F
MDNAVYHFERYELDTCRGRLSHDGQQIHVEPQAVDLLCYLVKHRGRVVPAPELLGLMGRGRTVSEAALATCLRTARQAIGDTGRRQESIRTVRRRGYQFVARVTVASVPPSAVPGTAATAAAHEVIRFCRTGRTG